MFTHTKQYYRVEDVYVSIWILTKQRLLTANVSYEIDGSGVK